ncbi:hypothetical protein KK137_00855 [Croceibacterium sp. LX-88]|jgi:hypothetical protein|uniref:Uncharacterized protein n=1 Tax=Croceibacterium selenioxidans TaxID=2838833 RepID=A0ABS5W0W5_9SPHN|nr:hypothetical protein [Croceibacterium selenioxidans]MBT2132870.1 hypothetical protein [Croceibacterium selenioxidans]
MARRILTAALLLTVGALPQIALAQQTPAPAPQPTAPGIRWSKEVIPIASGEWTGPRLADGQPDVQGFWSNTISNHSNFTDPQAGPPGEPSGTAKLPRDQRAPSRVSDPADGEIPYRPEARALQADFAHNFPNPTEPQYIEPLARCAPAGVPKSFMWHGYELRQYPGYVVLLFDSGNRIIRLEDGAPLSDKIKLWNGDSRGHWEGNTLVVSVRNNNGKALFGRYGDFMSENGTVEERYIFDADGKRFNYVATFTDPTVYTRPWTATIPARRYTDADEPDGWHFDVQPVNIAGGTPRYEHHERICVENNGPFGGGAVGVPFEGSVIAR